MSYIGTEPKDIRSFGRTQFDYTASQGQTAFTGADDDGKVLAFTAGQINVFVNGIFMDDSDFTTTGTGTVTLASAANLNDVISIVSFESNIPDNDYVPASGGTFSGDVDFGSNKITYANLYNNLSDLPSASTYHGMFAHVHNTGLAYYSHAGAWIPLANLTGAAFTGNVGVNSTPTAALDVRRSDTDGKIAEFHQSGGYGFDISSSQTVATMGSGYLQAWKFTTDAGSGAVEQMRISKEGYVTKPNHPSFFAYSTASNLVTNQAQIPADFNATLTNVGGHFNTSSKRFVAPVAGSYYFSVSGQLASASALAHEHALGVFIRKNGATFKDQYGGNYGSGTSAQYMTVVCNAVMSLAANDYVDVEYRPHTTVNIEYSGGTRRCTFSGYLIG